MQARFRAGIRHINFVLTLLHLTASQTVSLFFKFLTIAVSLSMSLNTAFKLKTVVDTISSGKTDALGSAPQEELHFTQRERRQVRTEELPTEFVEKRLPEGHSVRTALNRISKTHHFSRDSELSAVQRLWDQHFLPTQVAATLYKVIVFGGTGTVRGGVDPPPGAVGLLQVAIGHERSVILSHAYRSQGLTHSFGKNGRWGASAVPCSINMVTGRWNQQANKFSAVATFALYPTPASLQSIAAPLMEIPHPFGLLLQFDGANSVDARSQLFKDAARSAFGQSLTHLPVIVKVKRYIGYPEWDHPSASSFVYAADDQSVQQIETTLGLGTEPQGASLPTSTRNAQMSECNASDLKFYSAQPRLGMLWHKDQEIIPDRHVRYGSLTGIYLQDALIVAAEEATTGTLEEENSGNKRRRKSSGKQDHKPQGKPGSLERPVTRSQRLQG
ncbi:unnamed protein product [Sympodiomycopsis kandeliae]